MQALVKTDFKFHHRQNVYIGKVRDVYYIDNKLLIMVVTDRISCFDVVLPRGIPYKGQILNQIAAYFLDAVEDIVPTWRIAVPDPMVMVGHYCEPFKVEMVVRGYLTGHAWRVYKSGKRELCGVRLPEGMRENEKFNEPIITPTTKAMVGHDEDISKDEIIKTDLVSKQDYEKLEEYSYKLFERGSEMAEKQGLILVDTKYEFGKKNGEIFLIDEVHTPDSSRYFYKEEYQQRLEKGEPPKQLSKEFVREWLMERGFEGKEGQQIPPMPDEFVNSVTDRYIELYEIITGKKFVKEDTQNIYERIEKNINNFINAYYKR